jgi:hypothetical protein
MNRMLAGRYRIISQLGMGGMGITYRAWDSQRDVPIVIKMPRPELTDADSLRRFAREIDAMVTLRHDHIVPVLDHGEDGGVPFVVLRFLPGGSLADQRRLKPDGSIMPTPPGFLRLWLPAIADAIDFIHRQGVVHRDVKPRNIFFDGFWNAFLGDFGIAKVLDDSGGLVKEQTLTAATFAMGTQEYMAPELFLKTQGVKETGQVDQYALAVTAYEMLAGVRPFTGAKAHIAVEHLQMKPPSLRGAGLGLPASLCEAIARALEKKPANRFPTCAAFAAAAIAEVPALDQEPGVARLLCPKCGMVLRIPVMSGGKSGACPTCKSVMRIAPDLGALWLSSETAEEDTDDAQESGGTFAFEEDLAEAASSSRAGGTGGGWQAWWGSHNPFDSDRKRYASMILPVITAFATAAVTYEAWSVYHQGRIERLERDHAAEAAAVDRKLSQADAEIGRLRTARDDLQESLAEMEQAFASASFDDVTSITPATARSLVRFKPGALRLDGLTSLSAETAAVLARHTGVLSLNGLTRLSDDAAASLTRHKGPVLLQGLLTASPGAVRALKANADVQLPATFR